MLIKKDPDIINSFLEDYSNLKGGFCNEVIFPETEGELSAVLKNSSIKKIPITISGAGTGVAGGRIPFGGRVISLAKLNRIKHIKPLADNQGQALVEAGVVLADFMDLAEKEGFFYPPGPTEKASFIGGNVATSASGARSFKHGTTRDFVLGIRVVLSDGEVLQLTRGQYIANRGKLKLVTLSGKNLDLLLPEYIMPKVKNASGYFIKDDVDAVDIFIGQEGTLGIISEVRLKLLKKLEEILDCYAFFNSKNDALDFVQNAKVATLDHSHPINALSLEYLDKRALELLRKKHKNIPLDAKAAVYFEQGHTSRQESGIVDSWAALIVKCHGSLDNTWFAQTPSEREKLYEIRHDLPDMVNEYLKKNNFSKIGTDIAVPEISFNTMLDYYDSTLIEAGLDYLIFGHIGESHMHVNILPRDQAEYKMARDAYETLVKKAIELGGTPSAEHGIGKTKHKYLEMLYEKKGVLEMVRLKKQLDSSLILCLDNLFPKELLA
ncbi:MAG: FAD-binding oxidoreductase [Candidatus Orphnella occulta]|nr:FAD-binding oxidoreductase [Candidatus Orphnella occulta]